MADWSGRAVHALAEFEQVADPVMGTTDPAPFAQPPRDGALPSDALHALKDVLGLCTTTPDECFVGIWEGFGWIEPRRVAAPRLRLPQRTHLVFKGDMDLLDHVGWIGFDGRVVQEARASFGRPTEPGSFRPMLTRNLPTLVVPKPWSTR